MLEKYVEARWPQLMQIGQSKDGRLGVCTVDDRVDLLLTPAQAQQLIEHWNDMQTELCRMAQAFDEAAPAAFTQYWYGRPSVIACETPK